jgi:3-oxoacyl-[acyl-carrier protein] reductase
MDLQLSGKTGLVTGASGGIGRAIALELGREGVRLAITARRRPLLEALAEEIVGVGGPEPVIIVEDLTEEGAARRIAVAALKEFGVVEILVNNAGQGGGWGKNSSEERWALGVKINFMVHVELTGSLTGAMRENGWGRIVAITAGGNPLKAALLRYTQNLAWEFARDGITANVVQPGKIMSEHQEEQYSPEIRAAQADAAIAVGYYGEPSDMANMVCFVCSPRARYVTGAVLPVDGGLVRRHAAWYVQGSWPTNASSREASLLASIAAEKLNQ